MVQSVGVTLLLLLESAFIFTVLALLFHQRKNIGKSPFIMAFSALNVFTFLILGADIQAHLFSNIYFSIPKVVMFSPLLTIYLLTYISEGTLSAQRLIYGLLAVCGIAVYISEMVYLQCSWSNFSISAGLSGSAIEVLLTSAKASLLAAVIPVLFSIFSLPIIYSSLREIKFSTFFAAITALSGIQLLLIAPKWMIELGAGMTPEWLGGEQLAQLVMNIWLGVLLWLFLKLTESEGERPRNERPLDIFFAFFGSYSRSKELEQDLSDWQNRYRQILRNASEIIVLFDNDNRIREANIAAMKFFGESASPGNRSLLEKFYDFDQPEFDFSISPSSETSFRCSCRGDNGSEDAKLFVSWNSIKLNNQEYRILIARDITREIKLQEEKRILAEQLAHSQRLESLGILAGGVAHDFNNYIHAILGHVDVALLLGQREKVWTEKSEGHLNKIAIIAEKAGELTRQLLGFARRGNYVENDFDPAKIFKSTLDLIGPKKLSGIDIDCAAEENRFVIHCDQLQLQQVLVNIIINAIYAMEHNSGEKNLGFHLIPASELPDQAFVIPPGLKVKGKEKSDFCCIEISDNGSGMDQQTQAKIFEPFFTTKPQGEGSGMGLSMAYGIVTNCGGWIAVESTPGNGSTFRLFLPDIKKKGNNLS